MSILNAIILGLLQGLTEFLPISSSGHLVLFKDLLGVDDPAVFFIVSVHFGTLLAVLTVFWRLAVNIAVSLFKGIAAGRGASARLKSDRYFKLAVLIIIGSLPAGLLGVLLDRRIELAFSSPTLTAFMLLVTGLILWPTRYAKSHGRQVSYKGSLLIGAAQAFAMLPGISRSGATISTGLYCGVEANQAVEFSFLLALPAILGATLLKARELLVGPPQSLPILPIFLGTVVAYLSGYLAIKWLLRIVRRGRLDWFSYYCWAVGLAYLIARR